MMLTGEAVTEISSSVPSEGVFAKVAGPSIAMLMAGALPALVVFSTPDTSGQPWWACWLIAAYAGLRLSHLVATGKQKLYTFAFFLYVYMFLGLAPMAQLRRGAFPSVAPWVEIERVPDAIALIVVGLVAFEVGIVGALALRGTTVSPKALSVRATSLFAPLALGIGVLYISISGPLTFLQNRTEVFALQAERFDDSAVRNLLSNASLGMLLVAFVASLLAFRLSRRGRFRAYAMLSAAMLLFTANVFNAPRYVAVIVLIAIAGGLGIFANTFRTRVAYVAALAGFAFLFPMLSNLRNSATLGASVPFVDSLSSGDYDSFAEILNSMTVVDRGGLLGGQQIVGALLTWIPRSLWPQKPVSTSVVIAEGMGYSFTNVSSPLWSEFYVDFGVFGVVFGFVLFGFLVQRADMSLVLSYRYGAFPGLHGLILPFYLLILVRGSLMSGFPIFATVLVSSVLLTRRVPSVTLRT